MFLSIARRRRLAILALIGSLISTSACTTVSSPGAIAPGATGFSHQTGDRLRDLAASARPLARIAFGSCARQDKKQPIWSAVLAVMPDLFLFTGDNVYGDWRWGVPNRNGPTLTSLRAAYADAADIEGLRQLRAHVPHMATWDDHDYGLNDAGEEFPFKVDAQALFADFWHLSADDARRSRAGVYSSEVFGPPGKRVRVVMLDTRYFRSPLRRAEAFDNSLRGPYRPDESTGKTMLGTVQWTWLENELAKPAEVLLLVSSIQVLADGHGFERWGNLPGEHRRLIKLLADAPAAAVVILSGDRHHASLYRLPLPTGRALVEITSSGLTQVAPHAAEPGELRVGNLIRERNFGTIDVDWEQRHLTLRIHDEVGATLRSLELDMAP